MTGTPPAEVTVVIPVRDGERYLDAAIASVREQTVPPREILVIDDGSSDGSASVAEAHPEVTLLRSEPRGPAAARNLGAAAATAPLIAFLDADDLAAPRRLEAQLREMRQRPALVGVVGRVASFMSEDCDAATRARLEVPVDKPIAFLASTLLVSRDAFIESGGCAEDLASGEMVDWFARVRGRLALGSVDEVVALRRVHGANHSLNHDRMRAGYLDLAQRAVRRSRASQQ
jgi:glycosyltransferase involved in cell wall biosynthesis